jgi:hypothetical protein
MNEAGGLREKIERSQGGSEEPFRKAEESSGGVEEA